MMLIVARPVGARDDLLVPLSESLEWQANTLSMVRAAADRERRFAPNLNEASTVERRAGALAATTGMHSGRFSGKGSAAEVLLDESGDLILASTRTVIQDRHGDPCVFEELIIGHTDLLARLSVAVSEQFAFYGSWQFGLIIAGIRNARSYAESHDMFADYGPAYTSETFPNVHGAGTQTLSL